MRHRDRLPQLDGGFFLTDGGIETVLIFHEGLDLPQFAAFDLLKDDEGTAALRRYYEPYAALARDRERRLRAREPDLAGEPALGAPSSATREAELDRLNRKAIALMEELRDEYEPTARRSCISGCVGPQRRRLQPGRDAVGRRRAGLPPRRRSARSPTRAADMVTAITMTYADEAIGVARAAAEGGMPAAISFTVETDGRLPSGQTLGGRDRAGRRGHGGGPAYYMINCAHPTHFEDVLGDGGAWTERIRGLRANASTRSHAELDEATELDEGDPADLGARYAALRAGLPRLNVVGGCCGTDHRHVAAIRDAWPGG